MAEALLPALAPVLTRWTMGGSAAAAAPADWRGALGAEAGEAELRLLALAGQLLGALTVVEPSGDVQMLPDIPALAKPPLAPEQRPRARRLLLTLRERPGWFQASQPSCSTSRTGFRQMTPLRCSAGCFRPARRSPRLPVSLRASSMAWVSD